MEGRRSRAMRRVGVWLFLLSAFLPVEGCRAHPNDFQHRAGFGTVRDADWEMDQVPVGELSGFSNVADARPLTVLGRIWDQRAYYPYLLVPVWMAGLAMAACGPAWRRHAGLLLFGSSVGILLLEAAYLRTDFDGWGPRWLRRAEAPATWIAVGLLLFWRRRGRGLLDDPEAAVSAQALLFIGHALSFPVEDALRWLPNYSLGAFLRTEWINYLHGFYCALAGLALVALPGYFSGAPGGEGYDSPLPWPSRSSTPTPTPISTDSTPTGTPSSTGPAPPASSAS